MMWRPGIMAVTPRIIHIPRLVRKSENTHTHTHTKQNMTDWAFLDFFTNRSVLEWTHTDERFTQIMQWQNHALLFPVCTFYLPAYLTISACHFLTSDLLATVDFVDYVDCVGCVDLASDWVRGYLSVEDGKKNRKSACSNIYLWVGWKSWEEIFQTFHASINWVPPPVLPPPPWIEMVGIWPGRQWCEGKSIPSQPRDSTQGIWSFSHTLCQGVFGTFDTTCSVGPSTDRRRHHSTVILIPKTIGNRKGDCAWSCSRWQAEPEEICKSQRTNQCHSLRTLYWFVLCNLQIFSGSACHLEQLHAQSPFLFPIIFGINLIPFFDIRSVLAVLSPGLLGYVLLYFGHCVVTTVAVCGFGNWALVFHCGLPRKISPLPPTPHDGRKHKTVVFSQSNALRE